MLRLFRMMFYHYARLSEPSPAIYLAIRHLNPMRMPSLLRSEICIRWLFGADT